MSSNIVLAAGTLGLLICSALPLRGQGNETSAAVQHRNDCRLAAQVLRTGEPHTKRDWALGYASSCAGEGPAVLAEQWRGFSDPSRVAELVRASGRIRDARLYGALTETAADRSRPTAVRVGAMVVLAKYVDPTSAVWLTDLVPPDSIVRIPLVVGSIIDGGQMAGSEPLTNPVAVPVLALLNELAAARTTEPREVWYAAAVLARRVRQDIENGQAQ
jgi:hypothetical protein